ncbi:hypothetical protein MNBD_GAMMA22-2425 [hydrothermal vent metagenome]|uniref:Uncharacterized protein n=1 Tax=hydrothermal vent metagenome TaxID=652676 RepID=A0A3B0ZM22_9ZZZZ
MKFSHTIQASIISPYVSKYFVVLSLPLTDDLGAIEPNKILIEVLIVQLKCFVEGIKRFDKKIKTLYQNQDDRVIFSSFPGAGAQLSPRILIAFGSNRDRYLEATELQKYSGVAPAEVSLTAKIQE